MRLLEELTEKYSVLDTQAYGKVVCIPKKDFISDLEKMLKDSGCRLHSSFMGGPVVLVPLDDLKNIKGLKAAAPEPSETADTLNTSSTSETEAGSPKHKTIVHGPNWSPQEDELLITLRKSGLTEEEIAAEFVKHFPKRTPGAVHNRVNRLIKNGKIEARYGGPKKVKKRAEKKVLPSVKEANLSLFQNQQ